jgi:hypothetical protein
MKKEELLEFLPAGFRNQGFLKWDTQAKLIAAFIATHDDSWKSLISEDSGEDPVSTIAEQLGCTAKELQALIKEASSKIDAPRRNQETKSHWANRFEAYIRKKQISAGEVARSMKKLLVSTDPEDTEDELLDELLEMIEP